MTLAAMAAWKPTPSRQVPPIPRPRRTAWGAMEAMNGSPSPQHHNNHHFLQQNHHQVPETEEDCVEYYQGRIFSSQEKQLLPLKEDLADWLNKTLGSSHVTAENFLDVLDNGVVVCRLAQVIQERAQRAVDAGRLKGRANASNRLPLNVREPSSSRWNDVRQSHPDVIPPASLTTLGEEGGERKEGEETLLLRRGDSVARPVPTIRSRFWENAARRSFFSRDNMENFIRFCRKLGVHENLLFESDDLVLHSQPRNVVLCLLEVSRLAAKYDVEPPGLVQLEKEIAEEESRSHSDSGLSNTSMLSWQLQSPGILRHAMTPPSSHIPMAGDKLRHSSSSSALSNVSPSSGRWSTGSRSRPRSAERRSLMFEPGLGRNLRRAASEGNPALGGASDGVPSDGTEEDWGSGSRGSGDDLDLDLDHEIDLAISSTFTDLDDSLILHDSPSSLKRRPEMSELDRRVQQVVRVAQRQCQCNKASKCNKLKVKKVGEGKYNVAGRNVFIRLLKGRHMMVRVGGGWDTLEHFLLRHDPCQVRVISRDSPTSNSYLHIRAKYRSPPPDMVGR